MLQNPTRWRRLSLPNVPPWLIFLIILTTMTVIIWGTLGLRTTAPYEDWWLYDAFSKGVSPFDFTNSLTLAQPGRPFLQLCMWIGYEITPNSFMGLNSVNMALFWGEGVALFALIRRLRPTAPWFALAVTVLYLVYPADNSLGDNRYTNYHWCVFFFFFSIYFLIDYWQVRRWSSLVAMLAASTLSLGTLEVTYPLVLVMPALLIYLSPVRRVTSRLISTAAMWYVPPMIMATLSSLAFVQGTELYETYLVGASKQLPAIQHLFNYVQSLGHAYLRVALGGWQAAIGQIDLQSSRLLPGIVIILLIAIGLCLLRWQPDPAPIVTDSPEAKNGNRKLVAYKNRFIEHDLAWAIIGLFIIGLGFAIYAYLPTHQNYTERVYYVSMLGGAIIIPVFLSWIGRTLLLKGGQTLMILGVALLVGVALQADLIDVLRAKNTSEQDQYLIAQVIEQAPNVNQAHLLVIFDQTHQFSTSMIFDMYQPVDTLEPAFHYLYNSDAFQVRVCDPDPDPATLIRLTCTITTQGITFANPGQPDTVYSLDSVIAFKYMGEDRLNLLTTWPVAGATLYSPSRLINMAVAVPLQAFTLLDYWPFQLQIPLNEHPTHSVMFNNQSLLMFLDLPSLPFINYGWSGNWTTSTRSTIDVWLSADRDYQLKMVITHSTLPETLKHITLTVNDQPVPLTVQSDAGQGLMLTGTIPREVIAHDLTRTRITFLSYPITSPLVAGTGTDPHFLGFQVDQFSVSPLNASN